jgi:hypothetical protein
MVGHFSRDGKKSLPLHQKCMAILAGCIANSSANFFCRNSQVTRALCAFSSGEGNLHMEVSIFNSWTSIFWRDYGNSNFVESRTSIAGQTQVPT